MNWLWHRVLWRTHGLHCRYHDPCPLCTNWCAAAGRWMLNAEFVSVTARPRWLIGEDENGDWWVPHHWGDVPRRDCWKRFNRRNPLHRMHYWNSRRRNQVVFLFG